MHHAALAPEAQPQRRALHGRVPVAQRGEAEGAVAAGVFLVAHAQQRGVEQPHQGCQHLLATGRLGRCRAFLQVARDAGADARQREPEGLEALELGLVLEKPPVGVVAVLLAAAGIDAGGLEVAIGQRADPHLRVGRRNGQHADAGELVRVAHPAALRVAVAEVLAVLQSPDARHVGVHVDQAVGNGRGRRRGPGGRGGRSGAGRHGVCVVTVPSACACTDNRRL